MGDVQTVTLTEFLLARISEDEAAAESASHHSHLVHDYERDNYGFLWVKTTRVLAECEAKRKQIEHLIRFMEGDYAPWNEEQLKIMAAVYASHPDYRSEWAP